ncbi:pyridoxamine 5'-phosphate oxidase family protein [Embleya sp. NBC_00896]|uniref:pyridoxamine 5'-phosphate oxidase family protein n=1 Tax=Embleya sp. NBC_00896 TaxID=2975961 RepID=UPI002F91AD89|nr:pyridoxamine 5'-phosphate oxidase family protein [Embleya sp. NBC_00896]
MSQNEPRTDLDARYSDPAAAATSWSEAVTRLATAQVYWLSTVRPEGRPHVTPLLGVWFDHALHFCTGAEERKARNLAANPNCVLTTGDNALHEGLDLVVEGAALPLTDHLRLGRLADAYQGKYGPDWHFEVRDGAFHGKDGNRAVVYRVAPTTVFGFGKGVYSQTRWRFDIA